MRTGILPVVIMLMLSSCSRYQYVQLSSESMPRTALNEFIAENDSFRVVYKLEGSDGLRIGIVNKSGSSLQADWNQSYLLEGNTRRDLFTPKERIKESREKGERGYALQGTIITREQTPELILPNSSLNKESIYLAMKKFPKTSAYKKEQINIGGYSRKIRRAVFTAASSPLVFRLHLALLAGDRQSQPVIVDHSFYVSGVRKTKIPPQHIRDTADIVITERTTVIGIVLGTAATLAILKIGGWLDEFFDDDN